MTMTVLFWTLGVTAVLALCRYAPGAKCLTWCKYKTLKYNRAVRHIINMCETDHSNNYGTRLLKVKCEDIPTKTLVKIYTNSEPFGCRSLNTKQYISDARAVLKERIAERHLLEL